MLFTFTDYFDYFSISSKDIIKVSVQNNGNFTAEGCYLDLLTILIISQFQLKT